MICVTALLSFSTVVTVELVPHLNEEKPSFKDECVRDEEFNTLLWILCVLIFILLAWLSGEESVQYLITIMLDTF